jgi:hypothetical protein
MWLRLGHQQVDTTTQSPRRRGILMLAFAPAGRADSAPLA